MTDTFGFTIHKRIKKRFGVIPKSANTYSASRLTGGNERLTSTEEGPPFHYKFGTFPVLSPAEAERPDLDNGVKMELKTVKIENPDHLNLILGHSHFIKTVEDVYEAMVNAVPGVKFGVGFCEASEACLVRHTGTDPELIELAKKNAYHLSAGHTFIIFMRDIFPINVLNAIQQVPEVARIYCATANPVEVVIAETDQGRGILGVIDGFASKGMEEDEDIKKRKDLLRTIGYKQ